MIVINECRIDSYKKALVIDASVDTLNYFDKVYISAVVVDNDKTFIDTGPSSNPVYLREYDYNYGDTSFFTEDGCSVITEKDGTKHIRIIIPEKELKDSKIDENIFFVYIVTTGIPEIDTPCCMDNKCTMGIAVNMKPIYNMAMGHMKELSSECSVPRGLVDMILRINAFKYSLKTGNYNTAIKYWKYLFSNRTVSAPKNCGCNGIN